MYNLSRSANLITASFTAWLIALAPVGKIPQGAFLTLSLSCGVAAIGECRRQIFLEAQQKAVAIIEEELAATELELIAESKVNVLQQQYSFDTRQELNDSLNHLFFRGGDGEPIELTGSDGSTGDYQQSGDNFEWFTRFNLPLGSVRDFIEILRTEQGWNQTQIIEHLWGVKKGGSERYKQALAEYRKITGEGT